MKLSKTLLSSALLFSLALTFTSCDKDDDAPSAPPTPPTSTEKFVFSDIKPNAEVRYQRYEQMCGFSDEFAYSGDTLILRTYMDNEQLYFEEKFSPFSTNFSSAPTVNYPVTKRSNYILMPQRDQSSLFYFYGNDTIWTNPDHDVNLNQFGCLLSYESGEQFIGDEIGRIVNFEMGDIVLDDQISVSCVPMILDLSAYLIYNPQSLEISQALDDLSFNLQGFVLIEEE